MDETAVKEIQEILHVSRETAITLLQRHNWDLTAVVNSHIDQNVHQNAPSQNLPNADLSTPLLGLPREQRQPRLGKRALSSLWRTLTALYVMTRRFIDFLTGCIVGFGFFRAKRPFAGYFNERYGPQLQFHPGSFTQAVRESRARGKLLFIYLHGGNDAAATNFVDTVLLDETVKSHLNESYLIWGCARDSLSASDVRDLFELIHAPGAAIMFPKDELSVTMVAKIHRDDTVESAQNLLDLCAREWKHQVEAQMDERFKKLGEDRELRRQQEEDYLRAVHQDQESWREAAQETVETEDDKAKAVDDIALETRRKELAVKFMALAVDELSAVARIRLTIPSGQKFERTFAVGDPIHLLYEWAESLEYPLPHDDNMKRVPIPPRFGLVLPHPAKELDVMDATLESAGLAPNASLLLKEVVDH